MDITSGISIHLGDPLDQSSSSVLINQRNNIPTAPVAICAIRIFIFSLVLGVVVVFFRSFQCILLLYISFGTRLLQRRSRQVSRPGLLCGPPYTYQVVRVIRSGDPMLRASSVVPWFGQLCVPWRY
jgi:hypothetical protein